MNAPVISKKNANRIPKPASYSKKRFSSVTETLKTLSVYDPDLDNKLTILVCDSDPGQLQSKYLNAARTAGIVIATRHDPDAGVIHIFRDK